MGPLPSGNGLTRTPWASACVSSPAATPAWLTVVGIAPDIAQKRYRDDTPEPALYVPFRQDPQRSPTFWR